MTEQKLARYIFPLTEKPGADETGFYINVLSFCLYTDPQGLEKIPGAATIVQDNSDVVELRVANGQNSGTYYIKRSGPDGKIRKD